MKLFLKQDTLPNQWIIVSEHGNVIAGPKFFTRKNQADDWAKVFASSWPSVQLVLE
jgi:hypothetical protein